MVFTALQYWSGVLGGFMVGFGATAIAAALIYL